MRAGRGGKSAFAKKFARNLGDKGWGWGGAGKGACPRSARWTACSSSCASMDAICSMGPDHTPRGYELERRDITRLAELE